MIGFAALQAAAAEYSVPEGAPVAKLRIKMPDPVYHGMFAAVFRGRNCKSGDDLGWVSGGRKVDTVRLGMRDSVEPKHGVLERWVAAGTPLALGPELAVVNFSYLKAAAKADPTLNRAELEKPPGACAIPVFTPAVDAEYEVTIALGPGACDIKVHKLEGEGAVTRVELSPEASDPALRTTFMPCK